MNRKKKGYLQRYGIMPRHFLLFFLSLIHICAYLESLGYKIVTYNYRCRLGEIDLIARDGEYLVFVEVKYRTTGVSGYPAEAVDARKQQTIAKCAMHFLMKQGNDDVPCRFDVVAIAGAEGQEEITLYKDAFTLM